MSYADFFLFDKCASHLCNTQTDAMQNFGLFNQCLAVLRIPKVPAILVLTKVKTSVPALGKVLGVSVL